MAEKDTKKVIRESADIFSINIWEKIIWWSMYRLVMRETNRRWFLQEECLMLNRCWQFMERH